MSKLSGQIDPSRDRVFTSMELHCGRYPIRAIRTHDFLYVRNFETERPINLCRSYWESEAGYSPTWMTVKDLPRDSRMYQRIDGKRPLEELYDVNKDPYQLYNLANNPDYAAIKEILSLDLEEELKRTKDPRILGTFEDIFYTPHYENQKKRSQEK